MNKFIVAKILLILSALPILMYAYEFGPPAFRTGAPGDDGTCLGSGCHSGSALNAGGGSVKIVLPNGNTYTPGVKQRIMVQIVDGAKQKFGFELTARLASDIRGSQAGSFTNPDSLTQVICADGGVRPAAGCSANLAIQFIEHTSAGYSASTPGGYTYQFDWTPPASNVGNVNLYVAANAGPGGTPASAPSNIYTTNATLTPAAATGPVLSSVQDAESARASVVPGEWAAIYGQNLAGNSRAWGDADFKNGNVLPTNLDGITVTFNNIAAAVYYISPGQLDVQVPAGISGVVPVVVTVNGTPSAAFSATVVNNAPSLYYYPAGTKVYAAATHVDYSLIGDPTALAGTTKARPGESIVLYVNGLAPAPSGTILGALAYTASAVTVNFGSVTATADYAGVAFAGGFQVNVKVPASLVPGDYALSVTTLAQTSPSGITLPVGP